MTMSGREVFEFAVRKSPGIHSHAAGEEARMGAEEEWISAASGQCADYPDSGERSFCG